MEDVQCLVCGGPARDRTPPGFEGLVVGCPSCGNYAVAAGCLDKLKALDPDGRREILRKAKQLARFASPSINQQYFQSS